MKPADAAELLAEVESLRQHNQSLADELNEWRDRCSLLETDHPGTGQRFRAGCADDLRAVGWSVAVHNDYTLRGEHFTFWLLTKNERAVRGEGRTDAAALNQIRKRLDIPIPKGPEHP